VTTATVACGRCESPFEPGDLRCAVCGHVAPDVVGEDVPEAAVEVLRCEGCGAAVSYSARARAPVCAFCGSMAHLEVTDNPMEQAQLLVPFTVDRSRAEEVFREWLGGLGWFRPADLRAASQLDSMRALWWVGWLINGEALVSWTADSEVGAARADWAPHAGQAELQFDDLVVSASRGLTADETAFLLPSYDLAAAGPQQPADGSDAVVEQFEVRRTTARQQVRAALGRLAARRLQDGIIPGRRIRNLHTTLLVRRLITRRVGFPAWIIAYRYRGALHRFVLSGQDPASRRGDAPISATRVLLAVAAAMAGVVAVIATLALLAS
jgi:hypothetical protein